MAGTIIHRISNLQDCPQSTNALKTKDPNEMKCMVLQPSNIPFEQAQYMG